MTDITDSAVNQPDSVASAENSLCVVVHVAQLLSAGFGPLILWLILRKKYPRVDQHARVALNWAISWFIYAFGNMLVMLLCVESGHPTPVFAICITIHVVLCVLGIVFPIMAAMKANRGVLWKYPLSIPFFRVNG
ncbi:MAG: DUF4870 domain-containing protein [Thermoguttaceae bacterium]